MLGCGMEARNTKRGDDVACCGNVQAQVVRSPACRPISSHSVSFVSFGISGIFRKVCAYIKPCGRLSAHPAIVRIDTLHYRKTTVLHNVLVSSRNFLSICLSNAVLQQAETAAMLKKQTNTESNEDDKDTIRLIVDTPYMVTTQEMEDHDFPFAFIEAFVSRGRCDVYPCCTCIIRTVVA